MKNRSDEMERLLLPFSPSDERNNGIVVNWHVEEGAPLALDIPLLTLQTSTKTIVVFFRERGQQVFLRKKFADVGQRVGVKEPLALVGTRDEAMPPSDQIDTLPLVGTAKWVQHVIVCKTILKYTVLFLFVLIILQSLVNQLASASRLLLILNIILRFSLTIATSIAPLLIVGVVIVYVLQKSPEERQVLRFREH